ncbi:hypothetical protein MMC30_009014 [Trapelia coarctata]|nr:hypothetical protein [Trapelia coarctata]
MAGLAALAFPEVAAQPAAQRVATDKEAIHAALRAMLQLPRAQRYRIVVEKLTKNVNEAHLREIFSAYGSIRDVDLPMNRQFMTNRGTAYILYDSTPHAESAIAHMHEAQLDGAVISVSIVLPPTPAAQAVPHQAGTVPLPAVSVLPQHAEAPRREVDTLAETEAE